MFGRRKNRNFKRAGEGVPTAELARRALSDACLETLERRLLLSVAVEQREDTLFILGDKADDTVQVADLGGGHVVVGLPTADGLAERRSFDGVAHVVIDMGEGNDTVRHIARAEPSPDGGFIDEFADLKLDTGLGNDSVYMDFEGIKGGAALHVQLGEGDDLLELNAKAAPTDPGLAAETVHLYLKLDAGAGADRARFSFFDVFAEISADLGGGTNAAYIKFDGIKGDAIVDEPTGRPDIKLDITSGDGDDTVALLLPAVQKVRDAAARMQLGGGNDSIRIESATPALDLDISTGEGDDAVALLLPAVQKVREAAARMDLGGGNDTVQIKAAGSSGDEAGTLKGMLHIKLDAGGGDDKVRASFFDVFAEAYIDLGAGDDTAAVDVFLKLPDIKGESEADGRPDVGFDIAAGDGNDAVLIGLLLPAVQKVREAAVRVDMGAGNDTFQMDVNGAAAKEGQPFGHKIKFELTAGAGNDTVRSSFRDVFTDAAIDLGAGNDSASFRHNYLKYGPRITDDEPDLNLDLTAGDGNDAVLIGLLLPAVQKVREAAAVHVDLGAGNDKLQIDAAGAPSESLSLNYTKIEFNAGAGHDTVRGSFFDVFADISGDLGAGNDSATLRAGYLKIGDIKGESTDDDRPAASMDIQAGEGNDAVLIGLLLPAVQKVREAAAVRVDLGAGNDTFQIDANGGAARTGEPYHTIKLKLDAGAGNDTVRGGFTDVFTEADIDLGAGNDSASLRAGYLKIGDIKGESVDREGAGLDLDLAAGDGNDAVLIGLLLPAVQKVREAAARVDLGAGNDTFAIDVQGGGDARTGGPYHVIKLKLNAGSGNDAVKASFFDVFTEASLDLGAGNDSASLRAGYLKIGDIKGESVDREGAGLDLDLAAGDGNDAVLIGLLLPAVQKVREAAARIDLGDGNDTMAADIVTGAGAGGGPHVKVFAGGGAGNDDMSLTFSNVTVDVELDGGSGNDRISADGKYRVLPAPNNVSSRIHISGGEGNDILTLKLEGGWTDPATGQSLIKALVDGGPGKDTAYVSKGVEVVNVEKVFDLSPPRGKVFAR